MTVVVERAVVAIIRVHADSIEEANQCFDDLASRVHWSLPKLRLGKVRILDKRVSLRSVSIRGAIGREAKT